MPKNNERNCKDHRSYSSSQSEHAEVGALVKEPQGIKESKDRTHVRFKIRRRRLLDPDNAYASIKDLLDGIRDAGLILDDSAERITLAVDQEKIGKDEEEQTIIEIEYSDVDAQTRFVDNNLKALNPLQKNQT